MKALIFNSGLGNRMGELTRAAHKSMARLNNGETIFGRQLRILAACGVTEFVVTTGPFAEQLIEVSQAPQFAGLKFTFVPNEVYDTTNYIYSFYLAREQLRDSGVLILHGDLVFDRELIEAVLADPRPDLAMFNPQLPQPEKDFKVRSVAGQLAEVSVTLTDDDCHAFQPLYKVSPRALGVWLDRVSEFVAAGTNKVYAENALNEVAEQAAIELMSYDGHLLAEVDTADDLAEVAAQVRRFDFRQQLIEQGHRRYSHLATILASHHITRPFLVCGRSFDSLDLADLVNSFGVTRFDRFSPNPTYDQVLDAVREFRASGCDGILSVGGGSAIDLAKCVKLFAAAETDDPLSEPFRFSALPHVAVPTTAGTGSESTHFSVVYVAGRKVSVAHDSMLPDHVLLDASLLAGLPDYQRKATVLDALCQCIEASWAVNGDDESQEYALAGLRLLASALHPYLAGDQVAAGEVSQAANLGGKAINLAQTTAPHAMSYGLTAEFGIAHGHAVALTLPFVWREWAAELHRSENPERAASFRVAVDRIAQALNTDSPEHAIELFERMVLSLQLTSPVCTDLTVIDRLAAKVDPQRLGNSPFPLSHEQLRELYRKALAPTQ